jgi:hypothetical protein
VVKYHGLARRHLAPLRLLMRPQLNGGTLARQLSLTPFQEQWARLARQFDLRVQIPFRVATEPNTLEVPVLLEDFGAERGMLLVTEWQTIAAVESQLGALGFGYSCLSEPTGNDFSTEGLAEMLSDWGWCGDTQPTPRLAALLTQHTPGEASE